MRKKQWGTVILWGVVIFAIIGIALYYYLRPASTNNGSTGSSVTNSSSTSSSTATSGEPVSPGTEPSPSSTSTDPSNNGSVSPSSGPVGTVITIHGSGFSSTGNTVTVDGMVEASLKNLSSSNGNTITFTMPSDLGPNCKPNQACPQFMMLVTNGTYTVAVISADGTTQTVGTFTVTGSQHLPM